MLKNYTTADDANIADVIWFIIGYITGVQVAGDSSEGLQGRHVESLRLVRNLLQPTIKKNEEEERLKKMDLPF